MTRGMVLGKFLPPHAGHLYLCEMAERAVDDLAVVVGTLAREPIPGALRHAWMSELLPRSRVLHLTDENPQEPSEHPDFWAIWETSLRRVLPWEPDVVFASERYGERLAAIWGAEFVPVDVARAAIPVSGTRVRERPMEAWPHLPRCVRPWFARRVCIFGPESTGKSTLATALAAHFDTVAVPEYARAHLELRGGALDASDMPRIARRQRAAEEALARSANRLLVADTDPLTTAVWSEALFGRVDPEVAALAAESRYALTLLLDVDVPWVPDVARYLPGERASFFARCEAALVAHGRRYQILRGSWDERFDAACRAIAPLLEDSWSG
jgi:HTH-type transcriptional regulator, transcriptional repressor of NAD biosynthesis genes